MAHFTRRPPQLRPLPGLSRLSQEIIFEDPDAELEPTFPTSQPRDSLDESLGQRSRGSYNQSKDYSKWSPSSPPDSRTPGGKPDENVPLLPLDLTSNRNPLSPSLDRNTPNELGNVISPEPSSLAMTDTLPWLENDRRDVFFSPDVDSQKRPHRSRLSDVAQCATKPSTLSPPPKRSPATTISRFPRNRKRHPFAKTFEVPQWRLLLLHIGACSLVFPILLVFVIACKGKTLFWARTIVGVGCGILGGILGFSLLKLATMILEASTWATLIHQSRIPNAPGVRLKDLAAQSDNPTSALSALRLLWDRHSYRGTDREYRRFYDTRMWSLWIMLFLVNAFVSGLLPFLLARAIDLQVRVEHQQNTYTETAVFGDVAQVDIDQAQNLQSAFESDILTWTMPSLSTLGSQSSVVSFKWDDDLVYFSEVTLSQLVPGGSGPGTFLTSSSTSVGVSAMYSSTSTDANLGSVLRFPRWGLRIKCAKIPDISQNLIPLSANNFTYLFTPRDTLRPLFQNFNLSFPQDFEQPLNASDILFSNDTLPNGLDTSSSAIGAKFPDDGVPHSLVSLPISMGPSGDGFITIEQALVRLNTSLTPHGQFGTQAPASTPNADGSFVTIGYDAVVCLEIYEPWIVEVYNASLGLPSAMRIVKYAAIIGDDPESGHAEELKGSSIINSQVSRSLNSSNFGAIFSAAHQNGLNQIRKDASTTRIATYVPSPMLILSTGGDGPSGYTQLSEDDYGQTRAMADASNVLPYFTGCGLTVARQFHDVYVTDANIFVIEMAALLFFVFLLGLISALFVPRLPLDAPRRGFDIFSWMSAFHAQELMVEDKPSNINTQHLELDEIVENTGDLKFRYVF